MTSFCRAESTPHPQKEKEKHIPADPNSARSRKIAAKKAKAKEVRTARKLAGKARKQRAAERAGQEGDEQGSSISVAISSGRFVELMTLQSGMLCSSRSVRCTSMACLHLPQTSDPQFDNACHTVRGVMTADAFLDHTNFPHQTFCQSFWVARSCTDGFPWQGNWLRPRSLKRAKRQKQGSQSQRSPQLQVGKRQKREHQLQSTCWGGKA